jgi:hypothetical protein
MNAKSTKNTTSYTIVAAKMLDKAPLPEEAPIFACDEEPEELKEVLSQKKQKLKKKKAKK